MNYGPPRFWPCTATAAMKITERWRHHFFIFAMFQEQTCIIMPISLGPFLRLNYTYIMYVFSFINIITGTIILEK